MNAKNRSLCPVRSRTPLCALGLAILAACGGTAEHSDSAEGWRGTRLESPVPRPYFTLLDTNGESFDFHARTSGTVTLLFFGYTHCPDVCPVHMASLGWTLERFPLADRNRVRVVFVSTDPERDSPERIRTWLDMMGDGFIGLRGSLDDVNRIQAQLGLPPAAVAKPSNATDDYAVAHAAQILAFTPDDSAHFAYPFGIRQQDWMHDLPRLLAFRGQAGSR